MSVLFGLANLETAVRERGTAANVLTVSEAGTPHVVQAEVTLDESGLLAVVGASTARNAQARPQVCVLYAARDATDYSLIVDAVATVLGEGPSTPVRLAPTRAVLHRPGPPPDPAATSCGSDCVPLPLAPRRG